MKNHTVQKQRRRLGGFTLIEIMIVVVIIGIIAGFGVPAGIEALRRGRIASVQGAINKLNQATVAYITKPGGLGVLPLTDGTIPASQFSGTGATSANVALATSIDQVWLAEGTMDAPLSVKMGAQTTTVTGLVPTWTPASGTFVASAAPTADRSTIARAETQISSATTPSTALGANFMLDGVTNLPANSRVESLIIPNCPAEDAYQLSLSIDGSANSQTTNATADNAGKVVYAAPTNGTTTVYVYVFHN